MAGYIANRDFDVAGVMFTAGDFIPMAAADAATFAYLAASGYITEAADDEGQGDALAAKGDAMPADALAALSAKELKALAVAEGIDLGKAQSKAAMADIITATRTARADAAAAAQAQADAAGQAGQGDGTGTTNEGAGAGA